MPGTNPCLLIPLYKLLQPGGSKGGTSGWHKLKRLPLLQFLGATWYSHLGEQASNHLVGLRAGRPPMYLLWKYTSAPGDVHCLKRQKKKSQ